MYALGGFYGVPGLKAAALAKFQVCAEYFKNSSTFAEAVHVVYAGTIDTDNGLRDIVSNLIVKNMSLIRKPE